MKIDAKIQVKYRAKITAKHKAKDWLKIVTQNIRDHIIIKVDKSTHDQSDDRFGTSRGI